MIVDGNDPLFDPTFRPCREDRCDIEGLHREHSNLSAARGKHCRNCPVCGAIILREPRKWARCSKCPWRIINKKKEAADARDQP